jgi:type 1 glutamine amidotransferase
MVGGLFDGHPWGGGGTWAVKIDAPEHPLTQPFGGKGFKIKDEIYQLKDPYARADRRVLLSLDLTDPATGSKKGKRKDRDYAIAWIKREGEGRVFYSSFGHAENVFTLPEVLAYTLNGIQYALGDLPADDSPQGR